MTNIGGKIRRVQSSRYREIETKANDLLAQHEAEQVAIKGCIVKTELILPTIGCNLIYFSDEERAEYGIPDDAIGALKPYQRFVFVHDSIHNVGRENLTVGEEIGHFVLHMANEERRMGLQKSPELIFCRMMNDSYVNESVEPTWMSREATYFAACLMMPRDRYGVAANEALKQALNCHPYHSTHRRTMQEKIELLLEFASKGCNRIEPRSVLLERAVHLFDMDVIENALLQLEREHGGLASRLAQRRRMLELGLVIDAVDLLPRQPRRSSDRLRFKYLILADSIVTEASGR